MAWTRVKITAGLLLVLCAGCRVGPDYRPPCPPELPAIYASASGAGASTAADLAMWWTRFEDPTLNGLIVQAVQGNLELKEACFRIVEARAVRGVVRGELFPNVDATAAYSFRQTSRNANQFISRPELLEGFNLYSAGFDAAWQLDVFGKIRRAVEAADAEIDLEIETYRDILVTLLADVATHYTSARILQNQISIAQANLESQRQTLHLVEQRHRAGLVSQLDVAQAKSNVHSTAAEIPRLEEQLQVALNRLSILLGQSPAPDLSVAIAAGPIPTARADLATGVPANLLRRRPDVRAAEAEVAAENARIGIAVAELYPQFTLLGTISVDSRNFRDWFTSDSLAHNVGPSIRWNLLSFGRILYAIRAQRARHDQALVRYQNTVLYAVEEVENALVGYQRERQRAESLRQAVDATRDAVGLSRAKYGGGLIQFQTVLDSERQLLQVEDQWAQSRGTIVLQQIRLYKALGGGWTSDFSEGIVTRADSSAGMPALEEVAPAEPLPSDRGSAE